MKKEYKGYNLKKMLRWGAVNFGLLALFFIGETVEDMQSLSMLFIVVLWIVSTLAILLNTGGRTATKSILDILLSSKKEQYTLIGLTRHGIITVPYVADLIFDIVVVFSLLYFSYPVTAILYCIQIIMLKKFNDNIRKEAMLKLVQDEDNAND